MVSNYSTSAPVVLCSCALRVSDFMRASDSQSRIAAERELVVSLVHLSIYRKFKNSFLVRSGRNRATSAGRGEEVRPSTAVAAPRTIPRWP